MALSAAAMKNKRMLLLKPFFSVSGSRCMMSTSTFARPPPPRSAEKPTDKAAATEERLWMPHPRTGIYFPRGEEKVMDGIPSGAATFDRTFWLRGDDDGQTNSSSVETPYLAK